MKLILMTLAAVTLVGCGVYSFTGRGIAGVESISIEPFDNQTAEFGVREDLTDAILERLLTDRTLTVVNRGSADAILYGSILSITDTPLSYDDAENVSEYEVQITVSFALRQPDKSEPIWEGRLVGDSSYLYKTGSLEERGVGLKLAIDRLVQDLINKLTSDW